MTEHQTIQQTIIKETQRLPFEGLQEVLDFIQFLKMKNFEKIKPNPSLDGKWEKELQILNESSLTHLEQEFVNYKELYPYE